MGYDLLPNRSDRMECVVCQCRALSNERICVVCGAKLPSEQAGPPLAAAAAASERKHLTIMFADLCGSTERIADADPEQARRLLDAVIARMVSAVRSFSGFVPQISGDGIVALFGAPLAFEDHALRACHAARHLHALIAELSARSGVGDGVRVRVAIHSDTVVVTPTSEPGLAGVRVYGSPVHLAARVEQLCPPGQTLITTATARQVAPRWSLGPPADHLVKGFQAPVTVMALGAERAAAALPAPARRAAPLVGRKDELEKLRAALDETRRTRRGRLLLLQGEAGIGKSRLVRELIGGLVGWRVLAARGDPFLAHVPATPLACLLRDALGVRAPVLPDQAAAAARVALGGNHAPVEALLWLLFPGEPHRFLTRLQPAMRHAAAWNALWALLHAVASQQRLLIVVEDAHWIDETSLNFLVDLAGGISEVPIALLVTSRPGPQAERLAAADATRIHLGTLPPADALSLVTALVGDAVLARAVVAHCDGNPFFIEETVAALAAQKTQPANDSSLPVPPSVEGILATRIDHLSPLAKFALRAAAVLGQKMRFALLRAICEAPEERLRAAIDELETASLLIEEEVFPELSYRFRHALTHQVAYGGMTADLRTPLHARAARALLERSQQEDIEAIGAHAYQGELWDIAAAHLHRSGLRAAERSAHREAVGFIDQALDALARLPRSAQRAVQAADMHCDARASLWALDDHDAILAHLRQAAALAAEVGDRHRIGRIASLLVQEYRMKGRFADAIATGEQALAIGMAMGDRDLMHETRFRLALTHLNLGEFFRARTLFEQNIADEQADDAIRLHAPGLGAVLTRSWLAVCLTETGESAAALQAGAQAMAIARARQHDYSLVSAGYGLGCAQHGAGQIEAAGQTLAAALQLCERAGIAALACPVMSEYGMVKLARGETAEALQLLERATLGDSGREYRARLAFYLSRLALALVAAGRTHEAAETARRALAEAVDRGERGHEAHAHYALALAIPAEAARHMNAARQLARDLGMQPLLGRIASAPI